MRGKNKTLKKVIKWRKQEGVGKLMREERLCW